MESGHSEDVNTEDVAGREKRIMTQIFFSLVDIIICFIPCNLSPNTKVPLWINYPVLSRSKHKQQSWDYLWKVHQWWNSVHNWAKMLHGAASGKSDPQSHFFYFNLSTVHGLMLFCFRICMKWTHYSFCFVFIGNSWYVQEMFLNMPSVCQIDSAHLKGHAESLF